MSHLDDTAKVNNRHQNCASKYDNDHKLDFTFICVMLVIMMIYHNDYDEIGFIFSHSRLVAVIPSSERLAPGIRLA